ncbi:uncharacterized protein RSE6_11170 [Rhynchosporium secalis]|uniref:Transcription factor domain-containing protein n=1 Tax=Rhynchosporium secalis TaxID=38038 RepID=A0A1E1MNA8_RHYSE|nr:uncharacterized protein RSE6_11170 [Rhynchosporium secalis]
MALNLNAPPERYTPPPRPPTYSFITINDPKETKSRSKRRQVRSAVAYYQHHKNDNEEAGLSTRRRGRKRRDDTMSPVMLQHQSSQSTISSSASISTAQTTREEEKPHFDASWNVASQPHFIFRGTRVDPLNSYPIKWKPIYEPILDFYMTYILVDTPAVSEPGKVFRLRTSWFPLVMTSGATFYAALSLAGCILHTRRNIALDTPALLDIRSKAISSINTTLSNDEDCKTDQTIGAVLCLCILESFLNHPDLFQMHMSGLARMVRLRGGLDGLGLDGLLRRMIVWIDFNHSSINGTDLVFPESIEVEARLSPFKHPGSGSHR